MKQTKTNFVGLNQRNQITKEDKNTEFCWQYIQVTEIKDNRVLFKYENNIVTYLKRKKTGANYILRYITKDTQRYTPNK